MNICIAIYGQRYAEKNSLELALITVLVKLIEVKNVSLWHSIKLLRLVKPRGWQAKVCLIKRKAR